MKLNGDVLLEIVAIVSDGIASGTDVSEKLRNIELEESGAGGLSLSQSYVRSTRNIVDVQ